MKEIIFSRNRESTPKVYFAINKDGDTITIEYYGENYAESVSLSHPQLSFDETTLTEHKFYTVILSKNRDILMSNISNDDLLSAVNETKLIRDAHVVRVILFRDGDTLYMHSNHCVESDNILVLMHPLTDDLMEQNKELFETFKLIDSEGHAITQSSQLSTQMLIANQPNQEIRDLFNQEQQRLLNATRYLAETPVAMNLIALSVQNDVLMSLMKVILDRSEIKETVQASCPDLYEAFTKLQSLSCLDVYNDIDSCLLLKHCQIDRLKELCDKS